MDSITGNDQKVMAFWHRVSELYIGRTGMEYPERTVTSLISRWQLIQKAVNKFQGFLSQIEARKQSGKTEDNRIDEAKILYRSIQKSGFLFFDCWKILRKNPKWMALGTSNSSKRKSSSSGNPRIPDSTNLADGVASTDAFVNVERPIGNKAAKEKLKRGKNKEKDDGLLDPTSFADWKEDKKKMHEQKMNLQERKFKLEEDKWKTMSLDLENSKRIEDRNFEMKIMLTDTSSMDEVQKVYIETMRAQILAKNSH